jgi:hypothetical protein
MPQDEPLSWNESRRLIMTQLVTLEKGVQELDGKLDRLADLWGQERMRMSRETAIEITDLKVRLAMIEMSTRIWGAVIGGITGIVGAGVLQLLLHVVGKP